MLFCDAITQFSHVPVALWALEGQTVGKADQSWSRQRHICARVQLILFSVVVTKHTGWMIGVKRENRQIL